MMPGEVPPAKKRRRARKRKQKQTQTQQTPELAVQQTETGAEAEPVAEGAAPKKKSRRGRRGGRGRRRAPRPESITRTDAQSGDGGEAPPPLVAEGD
ncbi:MAG: hypothetical protein ACT443_02605 [Gemmatimonadota bacterium]